MALARRSRRERRPRRALPLRPLPGDRQGRSPAGSLDAWTTLAGLAARTTTLRLGTMVSPVTFRPASVLAKSVVTVDHISGGRAELGIGAGWFEREHDAYGFPFLTTRERLDELDRQLEEITRQWTEADDIWPKPVQQPRPPIIVGGTAKPRTVRAAVRFADEYNTVFPTVDEARERKQILDDGRARGRPRPARLLDDDRLPRRPRRRRGRAAAGAVPRRSIGGDLPPVRGTVEQVVDQLRAYEAVGVERVMLQQLLHDDLEHGRPPGRGRDPSTLGPCVSSSCGMPRLRPAIPMSCARSPTRAGSRAGARRPPRRARRSTRCSRAHCCARARPPTRSRARPASSPSPTSGSRPAPTQTPCARRWRAAARPS